MKTNPKKQCNCDLYSELLAALKQLDAAYNHKTLCLAKKRARLVIDQVEKVIDLCGSPTSSVAPMELTTPE